METDGLKLSVYLGERDRHGGGLLSDVLMDIYTRGGVRAAALLRGAEGFGLRHRVQTERLLTLSEDLPVLAVAVDARERILALLEEVQSVSPHGLITLERARLLEGAAIPPGRAASGRAAAGDLSGSRPGASEDFHQLTIFGARGDRLGGLPAHIVVVDMLHSRGFSGASALLGVDGAVAGTRRRARLLGGNAEVPLLMTAIGSQGQIAGALPELQAMLGRRPMTLERVRVCKRDGVLLADPSLRPSTDSEGRPHWQKLVVQTGEQDRHERRPIHAALVRRLRRVGAAGATALRAQWGYGGEHAPHGERFSSIGRRAPVLTVVLDTPENMLRWFPIIDEMTARTGLVTSEVVPVRGRAAPLPR